MFDQDDLYPHLITEFRGARVAVPLGDAGYCDNEDYVVAPLCYQPLPQREISWGRSYPIHRIKLMRVWREKHSSPSMIRTLEGGRMELYCVNPRGMFVWLPILGCTTGKRAGRIYDKWEIFVMRDGEVQSMVRCDDLEFEHWPED
ncbi:MAG TPA: hypothetical protein VMN38_08525 [Sphingomicrobium sp.]|nr:hypothetical protein [Sphingomicrobium sp.]